MAYTSTVTTLISTIAGDLAVSESLVYYLTPCCHASAKGLEDYVGCRKCFREIDPVLGDAWARDDEAGWSRFHSFLVGYVGLTDALADKTVASVASAAKEVK